MRLVRANSFMAHVIGRKHYVLLNGWKMNIGKFAWGIVPPGHRQTSIGVRLSQR